MQDELTGRGDYTQGQRRQLWRLSALRKLVQSEVFTLLPSGRVPQEPWGYKRGKAAEQVGVVGPQPHLAYSSSTFILFDILRFQVRFSLTGVPLLKLVEIQ